MGRERGLLDSAKRVLVLGSKERVGSDLGSDEGGKTVELREKIGLATRDGTALAAVEGPERTD